MLTQIHVKSIVLFSSEEAGLVSVKTTSSANRQILWDYPPILTPQIVSQALMVSVRGSITNEKIKGDKGHPC